VIPGLILNRCKLVSTMVRRTESRLNSVYQFIQLIVTVFWDCFIDLRAIPGKFVLSRHCGRGEHGWENSTCR
jgi:hypothetical protein